MIKILWQQSMYWVHTWGMWLPIQIFGTYCIYQLLDHPPVYWWLYTVIGYVCVMLLGVSACYHRLLSHRSFTTGAWRRRFLLLCAVMSGQGSPIYWVCIHRGYHHKVADTEKDVHSPQHGFWHAYLTWMFKIKQDALSTKYAVDMLADKELVFLHKNFIFVFWTLHAIVFALDPTIWLWGLVFPAFIAFHSFAINNSVNHWTKLGYRNYSTKDNSINVLWLWPIILGEAWHNNHHANSKSSNFKTRWWELDPTNWLIVLIKSND